MKYLKEYYTKKEQAQLIFNLVLYSIFLYFTIDLIIQNESIAGKVFLFSILVVFLGITLLHEYLTYQYRSAIYSLTKEANAQVGMQKLKKLKKLDILKSYDVSIFMFKCLAFIDIADPLQTLSHVDQKDTPTSSKDVTLMKAYALFRANIQLNNKTQTKKAYQKLIELKNLKIKGKSFSPLFSWNDIDAEYEIMMKDYKKALSFLNQAQEEFMNNREKAHHYYLHGLALYHLNDFKQAIEKFTNCVNVGGTMYQVSLATSYLEEIK